MSIDLIVKQNVVAENSKKDVILIENKITIATTSLKQKVITICLITIAKPIIKEFCNVDVDYVIDKDKLKISVVKSTEAPFLLK